MKKLILMTSLLMFTQSSFATEMLHCETFPTRFEATLTLEPSDLDQFNLVLDLKKEDAVYHGQFVAQINSEEQWILAKGKIGDSEAGIQGSTKRKQNGSLQLALYTQDHRVDLGFGLHLTCR